MRIAVLSNVNLDMMNMALAKKHEVFQADGYGQWVSYALTQNEQLVQFAPKLIFVLLDGNALLETCVSYEQGVAELQNNIQYIRTMADNYADSTLVVSTIDFCPKRLTAQVDIGVGEKWSAFWREELNKSVSIKKNILPFDLQELIANEGRKNIYDDKMWYMGSIPYGVKSISVFVEAINDFVEKVSYTRKKVLVVDLDNTLWGGVVGEEGPLGITLGESKLGAAYRDAQKRIKEIKDTGILLAIVSKNNDAEVQEAFRTNPHMVLHEDDFVLMKNNWQQKFENIQQIAKELNLGLDAFVFWDDNEVEREAVKINLPMVSVPDFPRNVALLPQAIEDLYNTYFWLPRQTAEDAAKTQQYQQETARKEAMRAAGTIDDYLKSLQIKIDLCEVKENQIERTVQLLNKTNQFNTNTIRLDMQEFLKYKSNKGYHIFVANVSDRYGDSGLVVELLAHVEKDVFVIDNFLMSCRVMSRQIENAVAYAVLQRAEKFGCKKVQCTYVKTAKNKPVENLWDSLGFNLVRQEEDVKYYEVMLPYEVKPLLEVNLQ